MRPFNGEEAHHTSSSSSPSPCPFSPSKTTMEEVWKDINLSSLHHYHSSTSRAPAAAGINLQEFLARPFAKDPPSAAAAAAAQPSPDTMLNLNSVVPDLPFLQQPHRPRGPDGTSSFEFEALASASVGLNANGLAKNCRFVSSDENSGDRRHKRMIKNRESAARSRARKQESTAYTNQLEQEVSQLVEENSRLKKQLQQLCVAAGGGGGGVAQLKNKKGSLSRTSTAPF